MLVSLPHGSISLSSKDEASYAFNERSMLVTIRSQRYCGKTSAERWTLSSTWSETIAQAIPIRHNRCVSALELRSSSTSHRLEVQKGFQACLENVALGKDLRLRETQGGCTVPLANVSCFMLSSKSRFIPYLARPIYMRIALEYASSANPVPGAGLHIQEGAPGPCLHLLSQPRKRRT